MFMEGEKVRGKRTIGKEDGKVMVVTEGGSKTCSVDKREEHGLRAGVATMEFEL